MTNQYTTQTTQEKVRNGLNQTYAYSENNPLSFIDPFGLRPMGNGNGPSAQTSCVLQCTDNYFGSWASGAAAGAAYGAAGGPGGSVVSALAGMVGRAMNVTATAACVKSCKDKDQCK